MNVVVALVCHSRVEGARPDPLHFLLNLQTKLAIGARMRQYSHLRAV